jgi:hypothetical protein
LQAPNRQALTGLILLLTLGIVPKDAYRRDPEYFSQNPIGCGPFQLKNFIPHQTIELKPFPRSLLSKGLPETPNLDVVKIQIEKCELESLPILDTSKPIILYLPYSIGLKRELENRLNNSNHYTLSEVEAVDPVLNSVQGFSPLLGSPHLLSVQSTQIVGRFLNKLNPNWNAHLWNLRESKSNPVSYPHSV